MTPSRARDVLGPFALMIALAVALLLLFARLAHAEPVATAGAAPVTIVLGWPELVALILAALGGVRLVVEGLLVILRAVAPRTRTTLDDGVRDGLQVVHDKIDGLAGLIQSVVSGLRDRPAGQPPALGGAGSPGEGTIVGIARGGIVPDSLADLKPPAAVSPTVEESALATALRGLPSGSITGVAPRDPQAGVAAYHVMLFLAGLILVGVGLKGCATAAPRAAAGLVAALDCEAANLDADLLADATQLAGATVQRWFGDQGAHDDEARAQIKADLAPLKSSLARCAIAGAVAAIVHRPAQPQGIITSALSAPGPDPELVRLEIQAAARELGWAPVVVGGEVL